MNFKPSVLIGLFVGATGCALAAAPVPDSPFYLRGDMGGTLTEDTKLTEFFGPVAPGTTVKFDPGFRMGVTGGYQLTDWFAGEFETGIMVNQIKSITGAAVDDATFSNVPLLLNARFQIPNRSRLTPYFGGGVGGAAATFNADSITLDGTRLTGGQSTMVFAYQAFGGVRYKINDHMGIGLAYHYFGTSDPDWKVDGSSGVSSDRMKFGSIQTHAFTIAFDYRL